MKKIIVLTILCTTLLTACSDNDNTKSDIELSSSKKSSWVEVGKDAVRARLKDGDSAKFKDTFFNYAVLSGKKIPVSCGEFNSKNSFGGYAGYQRYVSGATS